MKRLASIEFVIHIFDPLILYPSDVFSALVFSAKASDPEAGSERQNEPTDWVASFGSHLRLDSSEPYFRIAVLTSVLWTSHMTDTDGSTRASSSIPTMALVKFMPDPPYSSGISTPIRPCSNSCSTIVGSIFSASSISRTLGAMTSAANLDTDSAIMVSVSEKWVIGVGMREE